MDGTIGAGEVALEALAGTILGYGTAVLAGADMVMAGAGTIHGDLIVGTTGAGAEALAGPEVLVGAEALVGIIGAGVPLMAIITMVLVFVMATTTDNMH